MRGGAKVIIVRCYHTPIDANNLENARNVC